MFEIIIYFLVGCINIISFNRFGGNASKDKITKTVGVKMCGAQHTEHSTAMAVTHTEHIYRESTE